ncbi:substrate-binding periplasmic protein [Thalassotalea piscium]
MITSLKWLFFLIGFCCQVQAQQNPLRIVADDRKLLQFPEDNEAHGPSADILRLLLAQANLDSEIEFMPWSRAYNTALTRPNTLLLTIIKTPEREDKFHWISKVSDSVYSFIAMKSAVVEPKLTLVAAKQKVTVVVRNTNSHNYLLSEGFIENKNLYVVSDIDQAIKLLENQKVDFAFTIPAIFINYYTCQGLDYRNIIQYRPIEETRKEGYIALNKLSDKDLVDKLVTAHNVIKEMPVYQQLVDFRPFVNKDKAP